MDGTVLLVSVIVRTAYLTIKHALGSSRKPVDDLLGTII
jgi:hypothetical protein